MLRGKYKKIIFHDHPEFTPNVTPEEMFRAGVFGGTYFRPIYSKVLKCHLENEHKEFQSLGWWKNLPDTYITSTIGDTSINFFGVKAGSSLDEWHKNGWIREQDPYGCVQWYCRFYNGRRSKDDMWQIDRWNKYTGPTQGRWKKNLVNKIKKVCSTYNDYTISPVIRQGLLQWAYVLTPSDLY